jgi:hypothetical protein
MVSIEDPKKFRKMLNVFVEKHPELFPDGIRNGYGLKEVRRPKKLSVPTRRIEVDSIAYTVRPSFVMPYHSAFADDVEKPLFLRKVNAPFWALTYVFGRDDMYWYRMEQSLGRNSIVGTTVKSPERLPDNLGADEKHSWLKGRKVYVPTTVGDQCILGVSVSEDAGERGLKKGYGVFKEEALNLNPEYAPKSVNTDGWKATMKVWAILFPTIFVVCCFLHVFIKLRDRTSKKFKELFKTAADKIWNCYEAATKASFSQRVRRLCEWAGAEGIPEAVSKPIRKLRENLSSYSKAYDLPGCLRTSNMVDRLMQRMDRHLSSTFYFHGSLASAELSIRGWALIHNFAPCNPKTIKDHDGLKSPAEWLNKSRYHENWLQNLLTSASLGGYRHAPPNPL